MSVIYDQWGKRQDEKKSLKYLLKMTTRLHSKKSYYTD